jgi:O-methyltransferase
VRRPRIKELPSPLQPPARALRNIIKRPSYTFQGDGLATAQYSPFLNDKDFLARYAAVAATWEGIDIRWRLWILTHSAVHCALLDGSFAEFGVFRGGMAYMVLSGSPPRERRKFYLFDTFQGIPESHLSEREVRAGFAGRLADVSLNEVRSRLDPWNEQLCFVVGDVFETLPLTETGPLAFAHIDLNAAAPTELALGYTWSRLVSSGIIVFDDYGFEGYNDQRRLIDKFFDGQNDTLIALPTGQAMAIKP